MAVLDASAVSGADQGGHDLRRRNVPQDGSNGSITHPAEEIDDKKAKQVCSDQSWCLLGSRSRNWVRKSLWLITG